MKIREIWTRDPRCCAPDSNLALVASIMWEADCGALPVVDESGKAVGIITDRDICLATGTRNAPAWAIFVRDVMSGKVWTCTPDDDIRTAVRTMISHNVRRLPVVDLEGRIAGIVTLTDVALATRESRPGQANGFSWSEFLPALQSISRHAEPESVTVARDEEAAGKVRGSAPLATARPR